MLNEEIKYFNKCHDAWLKQYPGKIALVKGKRLIGTYDTEEEALAEGARRYGFDGFLVRRITETSPEIQIPALTLGLLNANSTRPT
jgi:hypothetical protein